MQSDHTNEVISSDFAQILIVVGAYLEIPAVTNISRSVSIDIGALRFNTDINNIEVLGNNNNWITLSELIALVSV